MPCLLTNLFIRCKRVGSLGIGVSLVSSTISWIALALIFPRPSSLDSLIASSLGGSSELALGFKVFIWSSVNISISGPSSGLWISLLLSAFVWRILSYLSFNLL